MSKSDLNLNLGLHPTIRIYYFSGSSIDAVPPVLSFEDPSEINYFTFPNTSEVVTSSQRYKDGFHSLVWKWKPGDELKVKLGRRLTGKYSGIKVWIYRTERSDGKLDISLRDSNISRTGKAVLRFDFSLNFTGWRAAWVALRENSLVKHDIGYNEITFKSPDESISSQSICMDLLCFCPKISFETRDRIVPPINGSVYNIRNVWQQTYRWSLVVPPSVDPKTPLSIKEKRQLLDLDLIEKRLINWFANESVSPLEYEGFAKIRWEKIVGSGFQNACLYLKKLNITVHQDGTITGSPLFARRSTFVHSRESVGRNKYLHDVVQHVLFPLALDYYFSVNSQSMHEQIIKELASLNSLSSKRSALMRITKGNEEFTEVLLSELSNSEVTVTQQDVEKSLRYLNKEKLDTIFLILEYIRDQGWTEGSAMGSLDHEMNNAGSGFINSLFLLRNELAQVEKLDKLLNTMKWYNDFGEIYQNNFEYTGTTADRIRTLMFYRLQIILMSRRETINDKRVKLRDMFAYIRYCNNALSANPALMGMFKPDFSCFHHLGIYGSSYTPEALTVSSMISYLLDGTSFSFDCQSKDNIRNSLLSKQRIAIKYSLPNSISGRFPGYSRVALIKMITAYAYFSIRPQNLTNSGKLQGVELSSDMAMIGVFVRLYDLDNPKVVTYLSAPFNKRIDYTSSIGSLQLLQALCKKAKQAHIHAAIPDTGHWVYNFAALSLHRRNSWAVSVKGFGRYIWDYESGEDQNVYGLYQSHGALQISNSEESLLAYDVEHGWDWTRVPGTTTIKLRLDEMIQPYKCYNRYFQHSNLVGSVLLTSKYEHLSNGVFAMRFRRPVYGEDSKKISFSFRKSVFFYNSLIVCLGSEITASDGEPRVAQTTLFQDKMLTNFSNIYLNGETRWLSTDYTQLINDSAVLLDTNSNGYYIPKGYFVNVTISDQQSRTSSGLNVSNAVYAVAWFDHGVNPVSATYEYAILVSTNASGIENLRAMQTSRSPIYEVLVKNSAAHVVRFMADKVGDKVTYGYAFFQANSISLAEGPLVNVSSDCIIMVEVDQLNYTNINLSISSPNLHYNATKVLNSSADANINECYYMKSQPVTRSVLLRKPVFLEGVLVNGKAIKESQYGHYVVVESDNLQHEESGGRIIVFMALINGESVQANLKTVKNIKV